MLALTYNNLGCYYKRCKKANVSLKYMKQALTLEQCIRQPKSHQASTKLNICAILSQLSKHKEAIKYATSAVSDLMITLKLIKISIIKNPEKKERVMKE